MTFFSILTVKTELKCQKNINFTDSIFIKKNFPNTRIFYYKICFFSYKQLNIYRVSDIAHNFTASFMI